MVTARIKLVVLQLPIIAGGASLLLGLVVLLGWHSRKIALIQVFPQFVPMQYNTAFCYILAGLALILVRKNAVRPAMLFSIATILVGALTGIQYLIGTNFGIDQFFMDYYITVENTYPGRMAPNTALSFTLTGAGLLAAALMNNSGMRHWVTGVIGSIVLGLGMVAVAGYATGLSPAYGWGLMTRMAMPTAVGFSMLGVGLLSIAWQDSFTDESLGDKPSAWWPVSAGIFVISFSVLIASALETQARTLAGPSSTFAPTVALAFGMIMGVLLGTTLWFNRRSMLRVVLAENLAKRLVEEKAAAKANTAMLRTVFDTIETGTIVIDKEGVIQIFNPAAEKMFGYKSDEVLGKNISMLMPEPDHSQHDGYLGNYLNTGEAKIICIGRQVTGLRKNGEEFPLQLEVGEMKVDEHTCFVGSCSDLTTLQSLESQLRQSQKLEAIGQLTGGVAHDFNNLLAVIQGNLALLSEDLKAGNDAAVDKPAELLEDALEATKRGADLTRRLLVFSRKQALQPRTLDLSTLVTGMEDMLRRTLGETIELKVNLQESDQMALIDRAQLENAILNLVLNARDAMQGAGRLTIKTEDVTLDETYVATHPVARAGDFIMLAISDTGIGMTPEIMDRAFDPFFTTKGVGKGSGLGLSMVHGFVKQSGGFIDICSETGVGTSVKLYLPRATVIEAAVPEKTPEARPKGGHETILMVEDDEDVRRMMMRILTRLGYQVFEAGDGPAALNLLKNVNPIDLLLTDVVLPGGMNGPQIAKAVRKIEPGIKILFMTGYIQNDVIPDGRLGENIHLINKPFSPSGLAMKVREVLQLVN